MTAPISERVRATTRTRATTIPAPRSVPAEPAAGRRSAQQKAYARRDDRLRRVGVGRSARTAAHTGRPQFVLLVMTLLAVALVATLWLSTAAAVDSYRLEDARAEARVLSEQAERLHREVAVLESAPELARRAAELGMTPVQDSARLVVAPDGTVSVVGEPRAAVLPPPPAPVDGQPQPGGPTGAEGNGTDGNGADSDRAQTDGVQPDGVQPDGAQPDGAERGGTDAAQLAAPDGDDGEGSGTSSPAEGTRVADRAGGPDDAADPAGPGDGGTDAG
jgi:hypothetical protein